MKIKNLYENYDDFMTENGFHMEIEEERCEKHDDLKDENIILYMEIHGIVRCKMILLTENLPMTDRTCKKINKKYQKVTSES